MRSTQDDERNHTAELDDFVDLSRSQTRKSELPATFKCTSCPKVFTRAYSLRSHLRTHCEERPFVCTVCGKAFSKQHDQKRHQGLHSGEKKFVCRGTLQNLQPWGCGRRFARADALGRHFRTEAGLTCIRPLLDEEAAVGLKAWREQERLPQIARGLIEFSGQNVRSEEARREQSPARLAGMSNFFLAAILQQYPALADLDWNPLPQE